MLYFCIIQIKSLSNFSRINRSIFRYHHQMKTVTLPQDAIINSFSILSDHSNYKRDLKYK